MEHLFRIPQSTNVPLALWMTHQYEQDIQGQARRAHLAKLATTGRPAWYCPAFVCVGDILIRTGTHLKTHYSLRPAAQTH
jgi:hypothetical protein